MSYLFFDIEAANRHEGVAKIYSFGYVLVSNKFEVIQKDEIIIDPDADYFFTKEGEHVKIECPLDESKMKNAKLFPESYKKIKQLLTSNTSIGYGTSIDAHMLYESCLRYDLPSFRFKFYDLVEIADSILGERIPGLNKLAEYLELTNENPHNGLADAFATYEACKKLLEDNKKEINTMRYKGEIFMYQAKDYKVFRLRKNRNEFVPKRKFKDMKVLDKVEPDKTIDVLNTPVVNTMSDELSKWLKKVDYKNN